MANAQDDSFDRKCGIRSTDGTAQIMIFDKPTALPTAAQKLLASAQDDGETLSLPGLKISNSTQTITHIVLTTDTWSTLDGLTVGMTKDEVLSLTEEPVAQSPSFSDDGQLSQFAGNPAEDEYRLCGIDV